MKNIIINNGFGITEAVNITNGKENLSSLQAVRSVYQVLGTLAKFPQLLLQPTMNLSEDDFIHPFHQMVFVAIKDMVCKDNAIKRITHIDIDDFLSVNDELYELWKQNNGLYYMKNAIESSNSSAFKIHYRQVKKYTLMRQFASSGVDITSLFEYYETDLKKFTESKDKFNSLALDEVEQQVIELGKENEELKQQLTYKQMEIDSQIDMLMKQKRELNKLKGKLA
ncbi:hypothetical protein LRO89_02965 [Priestia megaterium]|uniref:DnaB-like helicase N-terminal domain-containing protein n=1 Tax=Priestia megaterium TaxID=1404 RepID=UPI0039C0020F